MTIGEKIKTLRETTGMTQEQLGTHLGCTSMAISYYEAGRRSLKDADLRKIGQIFGVNFADLLALRDGQFSSAQVVYRRGSQGLTSEQRMAEEDALRKLDQVLNGKSYDQK